MIKIGSTDLGKTIRILREIKGLSRAELAESARISESHLKKIESGIRKPGIDTYQRIIEVLDADIVISSGGKGSLKERCMMKVQEILMNSTEKQAVFMTGIMEAIAENMDRVMQ